MDLALASRRLAFAEERAALRQLEETELLNEICFNNPKNNCNRGREARQALIVANAVRATLAAERQVASEQVNEAETSLQVSQKILEAAEDRLRAADRQVGDLLESMEDEGITSFSSLFSKQNIFRPLRRKQHACSSTSDDSDLESHLSDTGSEC